MTLLRDALITVAVLLGFGLLANAVLLWPVQTILVSVAGIWWFLRMEMRGEATE